MKTNTLEVWKVAKALREKYAGIYRYGFNGKENDRDWGMKWIQDYGFRLYNPSIARFLSIDPIFKDYPELTVYQFAANMPIYAIDYDGLQSAGATTARTIHTPRSTLRVERGASRAPMQVVHRGGRRGTSSVNVRANPNYSPNGGTMFIYEVNPSSGFDYHGPIEFIQEGTFEESKDPLLQSFRDGIKKRNEEIKNHIADVPEELIKKLIAKHASGLMLTSYEDQVLSAYNEDLDKRRKAHGNRKDTRDVFEQYEHFIESIEGEARGRKVGEVVYIGEGQSGRRKSSLRDTQEVANEMYPGMKLGTRLKDPVRGIKDDSHKREAERLTEFERIHGRKPIFNGIGVGRRASEIRQNNRNKGG